MYKEDIIYDLSKAYFDVFRKRKQLTFLLELLIKSHGLVHCNKILEDRNNRASECIGC